MPGGFGCRGAEGKSLAAHFARTNDKPYLGINTTTTKSSYPVLSLISFFLLLGVCLGFQVAVIEFARNVLGWKGKHDSVFVYG